jgi:hypothetical protein
MVTECLRHVRERIGKPRQRSFVGADIGLGLGANTTTINAARAAAAVSDTTTAV